jgi:putative oxidoreductase
MNPKTRFVVPAARALFAAIFIFAAFGHFSPQTIAFAASQGVPLASLAVPLSGVLSLVGGLSVLLGYRARLGGILLVAFLVPVTLSMHRFWAAPDPMAAMMQRVMFLKNLALTGGALLIAYFGAGPVSLDERRAQAAGARAPTGAETLVPRPGH